MARVTAVKQPMTKAQLLSAIAEEAGLTRKQVTDVMESLGGQIERHIKKRGPGTFTLPGLLKIKTMRKPARKARKGVNPFTGEEATFAAKPAHTVVKIQPLKGLKDLVASFVQRCAGPACFAGHRIDRRATGQILVPYEKALL